ncbi:energy transducer TonB [Rhodocyclus tenuis]|uniref:Energy transducer TonB n=2 Tax=Rhodocyclus gracilis TaxID=2929842 RepID=A0ABX0WHQ0_9RHOO|nr:energy transducer TonB [Rhodocyclus gracilis]
MALLVLMHNTALMPSRLALALALSVTLHAAILLAGAIHRKAPPPPTVTLEARLRPPVAPAEALLKNTLDATAKASKADTSAPPPATPPEPPPVARAPAKDATAAPPKPAPASTHSEARPEPPANEVRAAQKKLARHQYYPPEAIAAGLEGEVRVLLTLDADGAISDVQLAASCGHAILDNAALRAVWAMGSLPGSHRRELILPVVFRLR